MKISLEVSSNKGNVKRVNLDSDAIIGRGADCDLRVKSNEVSRHHCSIRLTDTSVSARDLGSSNGTFLDGKLLPPSEDVMLESGAELSIGPVRFRIRFNEAVSAQDAAPPTLPATASNDVSPAAIDAAADENEERHDINDAKQIAPTAEPAPPRRRRVVSEQQDGKPPINDTAIAEGAMPDQDDEAIVEPEEGTVFAVDDSDEAATNADDDDELEVEIELDDDEPSPSELMEVEVGEVEVEVEVDEVEVEVEEVEVEVEEPDDDIEFAASTPGHADDGAAEDFAEAKDVELVDDQAATSGSAGKMKSLFGLFGRKKKTEAAVAASEQALEVEPAAELAEAASPPSAAPKPPSEEVEYEEVEVEVEVEVDDEEYEYEEVEVEVEDEEDAASQDEEPAEDAAFDFLNQTDSEPEDELGDFLNQMGR